MILSQPFTHLHHHPSQISIHRFTLANLFKSILESPSDVHGLLLGPRSFDLSISGSTWPITNFIIFPSVTDAVEELSANIKIDESKYTIIGYFKYRYNTSLNSITLNEMNILYYILNNIVQRVDVGMIFALFTERMISNQSMLLLNSENIDTDHMSTNTTIEHCYVFRTVNYCKTFEELQSNLLPIVLSNPIHVKIENLISTSSSTQNLKYKSLTSSSSNSGNNNSTNNTTSTFISTSTTTTPTVITSTTTREETHTMLGDTVVHHDEENKPTTTPPETSSFTLVMNQVKDDETKKSVILASQTSVQQLEKYFSQSLDELKQLTEQVQQSRFKLLQLKEKKEIKSDELNTIL
ncbi:hypothetical protein C9374_003769 [Naegleria lovaniensis]|uniref:Uncharacterized protein n=1 Tax=Naegleria lovaniensis TaxID=51637 RepID=A0AA88H3L4_NAELO|nr:uncharacterized protein C9374_003769 [Naegleria lovaniensis]KAG2394005.1 hypothetical protein C9374_003769 [Naegleria lovaniensis]